MTTKNLSFELLHEVVAEDDHFSDKTHEKVADTLFRLMESTDKGVTIGLEGGWGSGKSTVVKFLKNKLESDGTSKTLIFLFDAWAHDGDPLRRIFLESLIKEIDPEGEYEKLQKLLGKISGRKKTVTVKAWKKTSILGSVLSIAAIFVPAGVALLSGIKYEKLLFPWSAGVGPANWVFVLGCMLALLPGLVLLYWWIFGGIHEKEHKWAFFKSESEDEYTQDITEDSERTSIEFEVFFKEILEISIENPINYERILIVVDNIDRVQSEYALSIWSVLQTFFQCRSNGGAKSEEAWAKKLWFMVPYDREGLSKIWDSKERDIHIVSGLETLPSDNSPRKIEANDAQSIARSFINKCFQVVAEVPEPVMSAWAEYCSDHIAKSLAPWSEEDREEVFETYKAYGSRLESSPTPRQIQIFINQVGLQGMRWGDSVTPEAMALYVLLRQKNSDHQLRGLLLNDGLPSRFESIRDNLDLKMQIAGMLFGVDRKKGFELLIKPVIGEALSDGDSEKIESLIDTHGDAFWIIWKSIRGSELPGGHTEEYRISATKALCEGAKSHPEKISHDVKLLADEWKSRERKWDLKEYDYSEALSALIPLLKSKDNFLNWLNNHLKAELKKSIEESFDEDIDFHSFVNVSKSIDVLSEHTIFDKVRYATLTSENWPLWASTITSEGVEMPYVLPAKGAITAMAAKVNATTAPSDGLLNGLNCAYSLLPKDSDWTKGLDHLITWAINPARQLGDELAYNLLYKLYVGHGKPAKKKIKDCLSTPGFINRCSAEEIEQTPSLPALMAVVHEKNMLNENISDNIKNYWKSEFDIDDHAKLISTLKKGGNSSVIWILATDSANKLAIGILRSLDDEDLYKNCIGATHIDELEWASEKEIGMFISKLEEADQISESKSTMEGNPVLYRSCLYIIKTDGNSESKNMVDDIVSAVTKEQWTESFEQDTKLLGCISGKGNHNFKDAVSEYIVAGIENDDFKSVFWGNLKDYIGILQDKNDVMALIAKTYFGGSTDALSDDVFSILSVGMTENVLNIGDEGSVIDRIEGWLKNSQWVRLSWFESCSFEPVGEARESLVSRVREKANETEEEENLNILEKLAETFKFEIKPPEVEAEEDDESNEEE